MSKIDELQEENRRLAQKIEQAERTGDTSIYELKIAYHQNKIDLIRVLTVSEQRKGITAEELIKLVDAMPPVPRYATGIKAIDEKLTTFDERRNGVFEGGIETGTFINFAGESGAGKTTLVLDILSNVTHYQKAVLFNREMGKKRIASRLRHRLKTPIQFKNMIVDSDSDNIDDVCTEIMIYAREGVKFFVYDSRMKIKAKGDSDVQRNANISNTLSSAAHDNDVIIFLINQMSESDIKEKRLALKGGGDQKYDSDMVLFYVKDDKDLSKRKLMCTKNRTLDEDLWSVELRIKDGVTVGANDFIVAEIKYESVSLGYTL